MTFFQVDRTQFPIGQGGFHSTVVDIPPKRRLSMVIDCGGSNEEHRRLLVNAFAERGRQQDILVISHFDEDHINGINDLHAAGIEFNTVFLPHVEVQHYLQWMTLKLSASVADSGELSRIVQTGGSLYGGVYGSVVLVGPPGSAPTSDQKNDLPIDDDLSSIFSDDAQKAIKKARGPRGQIFSCSQSLTFKDIDWLFRFYSREWVFPNEVRTIWSLPLFAALKAVIDRTLKSMNEAAWTAFSTDLETALAAKVASPDAGQVISILGPNPKIDDPRLKPLTTLQSEIANGGLSCKHVLSQLYLLSESLKNYNDASLCVYSGPAQRGIGHRRMQFSRKVQLGQRALRTPNQAGVPTREVGWISTGDADFSTENKLHDFLMHYFAEIALTSIFVLPHHGSRMSYDPNMDRLRELIARLCDRPLFIASANPEHKKYGHPHWPVESTCRKAGDFYVVDQDLASIYGESVSTELSAGAMLFL